MITGSLLLCLLAVLPAIGSPAPSRTIELEVKKSIDHLKAIKEPLETPRLDHATQQVQEQRDDLKSAQTEAKKSYIYLQPRSERNQLRAQPEPEVKYQILRVPQQNREDTKAQKEDRTELPVQKEEQKRDEILVQKEEQKRDETLLQKEEQKREDAPLQKEEQKPLETPVHKEEQKKDEPTAQREESKRDQLEEKKAEFQLKVEERRFDQIQVHSEKGIPEQRVEKPLEVKTAAQAAKLQESEPARHEEDHHKEEQKTVIREDTKSLKYELPTSEIRQDIVSLQLPQNQIRKDQPELQESKIREEAPVKAPIKGLQVSHALPIQTTLVQVQEEGKGTKKLEQSPIRAPTKNQKLIQQEEQIEVQSDRENTKNADLRAPRYSDLAQPQRAPLGYESALSHNRVYRQRPVYLVPARYSTIPGVVIRSYPAPVLGGPVLARAHLQRARYPPSPVQGYRRNHRTGLDHPVYGSPMVSFYSPITRQFDDGRLGF